MGENTKTEWAHHTFNPWLGCTKLSAACDHCYAETWADRFGLSELWAGKRRRTSAANWLKPLGWNRRAEAEGRRYRVFCASLADVFDNQVPVSWREDLWALIERTPNLDWLLLTMRPQNIVKMLPADWGAGWPNVWLGTTVENQQEADRRIPQLLSVPAQVRFLSCEPLLGPLDLRRWLVISWQCSYCGGYFAGRWKLHCPDCGAFGGLSGSHAFNGRGFPRGGICRRQEGRGVDWVIAGGESGPKARPSHPDWFRDLRDQCANAGTAFLFKQWGEYRPAQQEELPERFGPECDAFKVICSNGFVGDLSLETAFRHKPAQWPQCFPLGAEGDSSCSILEMRRVGKKAAGNLLDGRQHLAFPDSLEVPA